MNTTANAWDDDYLDRPASWGMIDRQWSVTDVAAHLGVKPKTVTAYLAREQMPAPDGRLGRTPWWWESTIRSWRP